LLLAGWIELFEDSPAALRSLSLVSAMLAVVVIYLAVVEAIQIANSSRLTVNAEPAKALQYRSLWKGASAYTAAPLFAASLAAVNSGQIESGQTARMYSLGTLLAGLTAWLLLRALRAESSGAAARRWSAYGVSVALFAYTHNFALFTIGAQAVFVVGLVIVHVLRPSRRPIHPLLGHLAEEKADKRILPTPMHAAEAAISPSLFRRSSVAALGFGWAILLALVLYSPWLPVLLAQAERVRERFWIQPLDAHEGQRAFMVWMHGGWIGGAADMYLWAAILAGTALWRIAARDAAAIFFLLQAAVPWAFTIAISLWGGRPILQDRYMLFSQLALFGFWGVVFARLRFWPLKALCALLLLTPASVMTCDYCRHLPSEPPVIECLMADVKEDYRPGDMVLVADPARVNVTRYYAKQAGFEAIDVRCRVIGVTKGHINHWSSLTADDMLLDCDQDLANVHRVWAVDTALARNGWRVKSTKSYSSARQTLNVALYVRE
jgi:hypothetical protein